MSEISKGPPRTGLETLDVHEELAQARITPLHWRLAALMAALTMFDGYDTNNPAYVVHYVAGPWHLTQSRSGMLISSGLVGFLIGSAMHGLFADRFGRRVTLLTALWIVSAFTLATPWIGTSFWPFCSVRLLTGTGLGVLLPLSTTYISEFAPRRIANVFAIWSVALGWAAGGTVASVVGVFLTPRFGWQSLYYTGSLSFLVLAYMHVALPESAKFLALQGRIDELKSLLVRLRPERASVYRSSALAISAPARRRNSLAALLTPRYRRTSLTIWFASFLSLFCIFGLTGWIPTVMIERGEGFAASFGFGGLLQIASFVGALLGGYLIDRTGSSRAWLAALGGFGGASVLLLVFFNTHALNVFVVASAGFGIPGAQFLLNNFTAQSYETSVRASAVGMELGVGRVGATLGPYIAGLLQQIYNGPSLVFLTISVASVIAGLAIISLGPTMRDVPDADRAPLQAIGA